MGKIIVIVLAAFTAGIFVGGIEALKKASPWNLRRVRQCRIGDWTRAAFGEVEAVNVTQRALRLLEEALELAQAARVDPDKAYDLMAYVYGRPAGEIYQELGGVQLCCLALADAAHLDADDCEKMEVDRVLAKPLEHFRERNKAKNEAGFLATGE